MLVVPWYIVAWLYLYPSVTVLALTLTLTQYEHPLVKDTSELKQPMLETLQLHDANGNGNWNNSVVDVAVSRQN